MEKLQRLFAEAMKEIEGLGIRPSTRIYDIKVNTRAKKRLGCCKKVSLNLIPGFQLEISSRLLDSGERQLKEVIIHEILHTCKGCFNHGKRWKAYAVLVNKAYGYHVSRTADCEGLEQAYRYEIICENCGNVFLRMRKSKVVRKPENYRCGKCKGSLEVKEYEKVLPAQK